MASATGLTAQEQVRLSERRAVAEYAERFTTAEIRRLAFVRWLVDTGRLNEGAGWTR